VATRQKEIGALEVFLRFYEDISFLLKTKRIAITGAPATGKTTLSASLEALGYPVFHEQAREIIQQSLDNGTDILPWKDLNAFTEVVWHLRNQQYSSAVLGKINFYDRTNLDAYAYLIKGETQLTEQWSEELEQMHFDAVFFLPVWPEIHSLDKQRMETLEDCIEVEGYLKRAYREKGYHLIEVPMVSVEERVAFIEAHI
jgi:predicted ATPase|tara:strand:+ start:3553 stop:4152 length:600 start_codon:yes stop_codon:yes gene_type:complete